MRNLFGVLVVAWAYFFGYAGVVFAAQSPDGSNCQVGDCLVNDEIDSTQFLNSPIEHCDASRTFCIVERTQVGPVDQPDQDMITNTWYVHTCTKCQTGYKANSVEIGGFGKCPGNISYNDCERDCPTSCNNCDTSEQPWVSIPARPGYMQRVSRQCNCGVCETTYSYQCDVGYYGRTYDGRTGCTKCPAPGTSMAGATTLKSCYVENGDTFSDETGWGEFVVNSGTGGDGAGHCPHAGAGRDDKFEPVVPAGS